MENLYIPGQTSSFPTPTVDFDATTGLLAITGESHPEDAASFYAPLLLWIDALTAGAPRKVVLNVSLTFFSATTRPQLLAMLRRLHTFACRGATVIATWKIDLADDDMVDTAADFQTMSGLPIRIVRLSLPLPELPEPQIASTGT